MTKDEFIKYIESIGFEMNKFPLLGYSYKNYIIDLHTYTYDFNNDFGWFGRIDFDDLRLLENEFKKELRSIKLKAILE